MYPCKIFFAVLKPFLNETVLYAKVSGQFSGPKTKVTGPIASKFGTNMQIFNLKLLSKFNVARPNRSRVMSKSLNCHTHYSKNGRIKTSNMRRERRSFQLCGPVQFGMMKF